MFEDAVTGGMPRDATHIVDVRVSEDGGAYVLLAVEANPAGYFLDSNLAERCRDGSWLAADNAGDGFTDRTLEDLRTDPPPPGLRWVPQPKV